MADVSTAPRTIDILDPRLYDDPWETYRWLRAQPGLVYDEKNDLYIAARHEDVSHVSRNQERYSAAEGVRPNVPADMSIISMDDPEHTRQRRIISKGFTPRKVRELSDHMREVCNEVIDEISSRGEVDFVEDFAIHLPLIIIAELMGLDPDQRMKLYRWSDAMMAGDGHTEPDDPVMIAAGEAFGEYVTECVGLIEQRRGAPTDDIISILTGAFDSGDLSLEEAMAADAEAAAELSDDELLMFLTLLIVAGNETTRNAITGGLLAFSRFPTERDKLAADPELIEPAIEEIVRYVSPVLSFHRTVTEAHTYQGVELEPGDRILMLYQSANRDDTVFDDPDTFRIDRSPNPHLGFGVGTHYCLGANLAKAELRVAFQELFRRLPDIRIPDDATPERGDSSLVISLAHLPAVFTPEHAI
ncbi:MAG: cytochrome P450 [Acidimicrobiales bacterium]|nr:cytochrome P450 [Acidimicrobiales bacterium]